MARAPHPQKALALAAIQAGNDPRATADRLDVSWPTMRVWLSRWRARGLLQRPVTQKAADTNVLPMRRPGGRTHDPDEKRKKREAHRVEMEERRSSRRARAIGPVDRPALRRITRRIVAMLDTGLQCPICEPENAEPLTASQFGTYTKAYTQHLDTIGKSLELEDRLSDAEGTAEIDYTSPEGRAAIAQAITDLGPRLLSEALQTNRSALRVAEAAVNDAVRKQA